MRSNRLTWLGLVLIGCGLSLLAPPLSAQGPDARMQKVLAKFVESTGNSVLGVGSWISGTTFDAATSDFDMRLIIQEGGTEAQQIARWQQARTKLAQLVSEEFGGEARGILQRTNLYAPNQLMHGVEDAADALERFHQLKAVPNLGYSGLVTENTPAKFVEGLYGAGAPTYVQGYERAAGRLFYNNGGKCVTGLSELAQMGETASIYTAAGTANTAGQWAEKCLGELNADRGDKVAKYLERLERDLIKSRSLSSLPLDEAYRKQLLAMRDMLKASPEKLAGVADEVAALVARGRAEAAILGGFENAGPLRRAYLRVMLDGVAAKNAVGQALDKIMQKVPTALDAENAMNFIVFCLATQAASESFGQGDDMFETMSNVCGAMNPFKLIGPTLLAEVMAEIIVEARANGFDMAAGFQNAWDLMEGIYSAWGRADVDPNPRCKFTLADLVANYQNESRLEARVMAQAIRASTRGLGTANEQHDQGVAQSIFDECWPVIRDAWRWERDSLASEYLKLGSEVVHTPLLIYYKPTEPKTGEKIICEAVSADQKLGDRLERMKQIIHILYGKGSGIAVNYYWDPDGTSVGERGWQRGFTFEAPGTYPVKVRLEVAPYASLTKTEPRVMLRREVPALVDIVVGGEQKPPSGQEINVTTEFTPIFTFWAGGRTVTAPLITHASFVLQAAGIRLGTTGDVNLSPAQRADYMVDQGVPCHLSLRYTVSVAPDAQRVYDGGYTVVSYTEPSVVFNVWHSVPNKPESPGEDLPGPTYNLDYTPQPGEAYQINIYALFDSTATLSGPDIETRTEKRQERVQVADIRLRTNE